MKFIYSIFLLIVFVAQFAFADESENNDAQLLKGQICYIKVGDNLAELLNSEILATVDNEMSEGDYYLIFKLDVPQCGFMTVTLDEKENIYSFSTEETSLLTERDAHVGMTLREIKEIYPDTFTAFQWDSIGSFYSVIIEELGVFVIDASSIMEKCGDKHPNCEDYLLDLKTIRFRTW